MKDFFKFVKNHILSIVIVGIMLILSLIGYFMSVITLARQDDPDVLSYVNQNVFAGVAIHNIKEDVIGADGILSAFNSDNSNGVIDAGNEYNSQISDIDQAELDKIYKEHTRVSIDDVEKGGNSDNSKNSAKADDSNSGKSGKNDSKNQDKDSRKNASESDDKNKDASKSGDKNNTDSKAGNKKKDDKDNEGSNSGNNKDDANFGDADSIDESEEIGEIVPVKADNNYFLDALFIGDSRTVGFGSYSNLPNITVYAQKAFQIYTVETKPIIKTDLGNITVPQALLMQENRYKKVYLMFGLNEMGYSEEKFDEYYYHLIDLVKYTQKDAIVYVQGIIHVSSDKDADSSVITNARIDARNEQLRKIAEEENVIFLDLNEVFTDAKNALPPNYAGDGVHLKAQFIGIWTDYLKSHAYKRTTWEDTKFDMEFTGEQFPAVMNYYVPLPQTESETQPEE